MADLADLCGFAPKAVIPVGESSLSDLKTRPDYAVTVQNALVGFVEVKAPGKGSDPRRFKDKHDKEQWEKLQSIPNLLYTDGNEFSLWRSGELVGAIVRLEGDIATAGATLAGEGSLQAIFEDFFRWQPLPPRTAKELAEVTARLCRLLRDEVMEQMAKGSPALTSLAADWRRLLFPEASNAHFADGYAQAVTFGLLVARARKLELRSGLDAVAKKLGQTDTLIGTALRLLTDNAENQKTLRTSIGTLVRVLDAVEWSVISKGNPDAWLYFYEDFLEVYDNRLRKLTGSYYTPPPVVEAMVRLVNDVLHSRFGLARGLASPNVTVADPAVGTGTYLLGVMRQIAIEVERSEGSGAVPAAIDAAIGRLIAFELQLGPYAVAQLRILAEITDLTGALPSKPLRMFVTDTLANPWVEQENLGAIYQPIAESRRHANKIKRDESITVVIGNPPYKEKSKGLGGWIESGGENHPAPLLDWIPPASWKVSAHAKHLRNLYVYFWRWATWKVFDSDPRANHGIVSFITVAGFLNGPGFARMRDYLRRTADELWVIDCSPEGHQPEVSTRIFQGVQQPVCIVLASSSPTANRESPAAVRYRALPLGHRSEKFDTLANLALDEDGWHDCPDEWRAPFLPASTGAWADYPALDDFFVYNGSGVMPGRTWVIAPDPESLGRRWNKLREAPPEEKEALFHPHLQKGEPGDRHSQRAFQAGLPSQVHRTISVAADSGDVIAPIRYGFRSFDRQWLIPDYRLLNRPNPTLWESHSTEQVYLTAPEDRSPSNGPALTFSSVIPDLHHYNGRGGRIYPLWSDATATKSNISPALITVLREKIEGEVSGADVLAYIAGAAAHPAYTARFQSDLVRPGLRIPLTADAKLFRKAVGLGRRIIWLHTFGERFTDPDSDRPHEPPRLATPLAPRYTRAGSIPSSPTDMPDSIDYDPTTKRILIGKGFIENVSPEVWDYEVSGKHVIRQWFSYRKKDRERPLIGDRRPPSALGDIQPDHWIAEYTTDLIDLLHVLGALVALEPQQLALLDAICAGPLITSSELAIPAQAGTAVTPRSGKSSGKRGRRKHADPDQSAFLD
ncbi:MAG: N-6 DNA methylase [Gemmatimonadota bacterium]|nr:N-6 DNA methylase [Gemmatimonadota bacterium]